MQSVQGVEDEPPDDQPTVEIDGKDPDHGNDHETTTTTSTSAPTPTSTSVNTWQYVWPADMTNTGAIQSEIESFQLDSDQIYVSSGTLRILFWALLGLNTTQIEALNEVGTLFLSPQQKLSSC